MSISQSRIDRLRLAVRGDVPITAGQRLAAMAIVEDIAAEAGLPHGLEQGHNPRRLTATQAVEAFEQIDAATTDYSDAEPAQGWAIDILLAAVKPKVTQAYRLMASRFSDWRM